MSYCDYIRSEGAREPHITYHNLEYGFPLTSDSDLFERLILEINQAGLSWETILKKRDGFRVAYGGFDVATIAAYSDADIARLLADPSIIRNRLKVNAAVANAQKVIQIRQSHGSFAEWIAAHHPLPKSEWVRLFKQTFRFTGGEIVGEFLMSIGYLPGAHDDLCPVGHQLREMQVPWTLVPAGTYGDFV